MGGQIVGYESLLLEAEREYRALFFQGLAQAEATMGALIDALTMMVPAAGKDGIYHRWMQLAPQMREWIGGKVHEQLTAEGQFLQNKRWQNGIECSIDDLENDNLGIYRGPIMELPWAAMRWMLQKVAALIQNGMPGVATVLSYDAVSFFNNSHTYKSSSQTFDNYTDDVLDADAYQAAVTRLRDTVDSKGRKLGLQPTHLIVGNDNEFVAKEILMAERDSAGATNINRNSAQILQIGDMPSLHWAVADLSRPLKPFIKQEKRAIRAESLAAPDSPEVYDTETAKFSATWKGNFGAGLPQLIQGSDGSGS